MILKFQSGVAGLADDEVEIKKGINPQGEYWITLWGWAVNLIKTDEGIVVDVWVDGAERDEPAATTYAFDQEKEDE